MHHPDTKKKGKKKSAEGGKKSGKTRRKKALAKKLNISLEGNKRSVVDALVEQANFYGKEMERDQLGRAKLMLEIMSMIHEYATEGIGEEERKEQIQEIVKSELPDIVKLANLSTLVGPAEAMKLVPVTMKRDSHDDTTLDGNALLANVGKDGLPTITKPESLKFEEVDETGDIPAPAPPSAEGSPPTAEGAAPPGKEAPPDEPKIKETPEERKARCYRQARELLGLYKHKVSGNFRKADEVGKVFYYALHDDDVPFQKLQQRVMFPKSATDQPEMMVKDVKAAMPKPKPTPADGDAS
jgi:hypothetical protein